MTDIEAVQQFHGHLCPGLAVGIRAAEIALREIGPNNSEQEVIAIVETDMCGVDAIQYMTSCTYGKGNLIHLNHGKNVFTFIRRNDGKAIRIAARPNAFGSPDSEHQQLLALFQTGQATPQQRARFSELQAERLQGILDAPEDTLFVVTDAEPQIPPRARLFKAVACDECGEMVAEVRARMMGGRTLCQPCFDAAERAL